MKVIFFLLLIFSCNTLFAQKIKGSRIEIKTFSTSRLRYDFEISIARSKKEIKVLYKILDSVSYRFEQDTVLRNLSSLAMTVDKKEADSIYKVISTLVEAYKFYIKDSLIFKRSEEKIYNSLLNRIVNSPTKRLENEEADSWTRDGVSIRFIITKGKRSRNIHAHNPRMNGHPLLTRLLTETLDLYRRIHPSLSKEKTYRY